MVGCKKILAILFIANTTTVYSATLETSVYQAIESNPDMVIALERYYSAQTDIDASVGSFLPRVDLIADTGKEQLEREGSADTDETRKNAKLQLSVPLFRGFSNVREHERASSSMKASYYEVLAQAERLALEVAKSYHDYLSAHEIVVMSLENLDHHHRTFDLVQARTNQGVSDKADLLQVKGRIARAKANLAASRNNLRDAQSNFVQLTNEIPKDFKRPVVDENYLPETRQQTLSYALANNQSLLASKYYIEASTASARSTRSDYYPQFDLVVDRAWKEDVGGFSGEEDETRILLQMNWNLYAGGRQNSAYKKALHQVEITKSTNNRVMRAVKANVDTSWHAYKTLGQERLYLREYVVQTKEAEKLYSAQFKVGSRSLLDLLDSQNELFQARKSYVQADYDYLYSQYRVIASMSYILDALRVNVMGGLQNEE